MAQAGDNAPMNFTRGAAKRIANAVRKVEVGDRDGGGLEFESVSLERKIFRVGSFNRPWPKGTTKVVMIGFSSTTSTISAINVFASVTATAGVAKCAIARDGSAWYLIAAEC